MRLRTRTLPVVLTLFAPFLPGCGGGTTPTPPPPPPPPTYASTARFGYIFTGGIINLFTISASGVWTPSGTITDPASVGGNAPGETMTMAPNGKFLYTSDITGAPDGTIINSYTIDQTTGLLTLTSSASPTRNVDAFPGAGGLVIDPTSHFLYAGVNDDFIAIFTIDQTTGVLTAGSPATITTGGPLTDVIVIDPSGRFLIDGYGDTFQINPSTGTLTAVPYTPSSPEFGSSELFDFSPDGKFIDATTSSSALFIYGFNSTTGEVTSPAIVRITNAETWDIAFAPSGKFAYVTDQGNNVIDEYSVDTTTGAFTPLPTPSIAAEAQPSKLVVDAGGQFLYVLHNGGTTSVDAYTISSNGQLTATTPINVNSGQSAISLK
jgi:6-phosphogluconolactonase